MKTTKRIFVLLVLLLFVFQVEGLAVKESGKALRISKAKGSVNKSVFYYPLIEGVDDPAFAKIQKKLNSQMKQDILSLNNDKTSTLNGTFHISYFNGKILGIRFVGDSYTKDTPHPNVLNTVFHYDLSTGKLFKLADLFKNGVNYETKIKEIAKKNDKKFRVKTGDLFKDWSFDDFQNAWTGSEAYFAIKGQNLLNVYFSSSYATGFSSGYDLPLSTLGQILNTQGAFYKAINGGKPVMVDKLNLDKTVTLVMP